MAQFLPIRLGGVAAGKGGGSPVAGLGEKFRVGSGSVRIGRLVAVIQADVKL